MPDHEDSLGGETLDGDAKADPADQSLGKGEMFDDGMEVVDLTTRYIEEGFLGKGGFGEVVLASDTRLGRNRSSNRVLRGA